MNITDHMAQYGHEEMAVFADKATGLKAFIAIHSTVLGPALGGCRVWKHATEEDCITDILRLSRAMTYKNAAAGLNLGGGKALIWADPRTEKTPAMFTAFGQFVQRLNGRYITTEDVGTTTDDMIPVSKVTKHVVGLSIPIGGSGDPSKATGLGIYHGIRACAKERFGTDSLKGRTIAIQGFGKVASFLVGHLAKEGTRIIVTDINSASLQKARDQGFQVIENPQEIFKLECDIFAPCALGGILNKDTIPLLKCPIVAGSANNQLLTEQDGDELHRRNILYAPDYIINAGGVINLSFEIGRPYDEKAAMERTIQIYDTVSQVIAISKRDHIPTARAADRLAEERIAKAKIDYERPST